MTEPDLSRLPAALRGKLEAQLARLPPEMRGTVEAYLARLPPEKLTQLLERGSPMLDKLMARAGQALEQAREQAGEQALDKPRDQPRKDRIGKSGPVGRENQTVKLGDRPGELGKILLAVALGLGLYYLLF